jgi:type 1 glutamine amidotransferase
MGAAILVAAIPATAAAVPATAAGASQKRVLLVSEARGFVHSSIPDAVRFFRGLGRRSPRFDVVHLDGGAAQLTAARLRRADGVVFANTSGELPLPDRTALLRFVRSGGALVGTHSATDTLYSWPGWQRLIGARFQRHGAPTTGRLVVEDRRHPVSRGLPAAFRLLEEFYEFTSSPRPRSNVLLRLDPASIGDELRSDIPLAWTRRFGRGRVFYDALGHFPETWSDPRHSRLVSRGLRWALRLGP